MSTEAPVARLPDAELADRLDRMSAQLDLVTAELMAQRASREKWSDGRDPDAGHPQRHGHGDRRDERLSQDVTIEDATEFARTLARSLPQLNAMMAQLEGLTELAAQLSALSSPAMAKLTETLEVADEKGCFAFARQGAKIADRW